MKNKKGNKQKKYYRPGTLDKKGTKISLKTQPYINNVVFNVSDPITQFHARMATMSLIISHYDFLKKFANLSEITGIEFVGDGEVEKLKVLLQFLTMSPIEITLKDQFIDEEAATAIELGETYER